MTNPVPSPYFRMYDLMVSLCRLALTTHTAARDAPNMHVLTDDLALRPDKLAAARVNPRRMLVEAVDINPALLHELYEGMVAYLTALRDELSRRGVTEHPALQQLLQQLVDQRVSVRTFLMSPNFARSLQSVLEDASVRSVVDTVETRLRSVMTALYTRLETSSSVSTTDDQRVFRLSGTLFVNGRQSGAFSVGATHHHLVEIEGSRQEQLSAAERLELYSRTQELIRETERARTRSFQQGMRAVRSVQRTPMEAEIGERAMERRRSAISSMLASERYASAVGRFMESVEGEVPEGVSREQVERVARLSVSEQFGSLLRGAEPSETDWQLRLSPEWLSQLDEVQSLLQIPSVEGLAAVYRAMRALAHAASAGALSLQEPMSELISQAMSEAGYQLEFTVSTRAYLDEVYRRVVENPQVYLNLGFSATPDYGRLLEEMISIPYHPLLVYRTILGMPDEGYIHELLNRLRETEGVSVEPTDDMRFTASLIRTLRGVYQSITGDVRYGEVVVPPADTTPASVAGGPEQTDLSALPPSTSPQPAQAIMASILHHHTGLDEQGMSALYEYLRHFSENLGLSEEDLSFLRSLMIRDDGAHAGGEPYTGAAVLLFSPRDDAPSEMDLPMRPYTFVVDTHTIHAIAVEVEGMRLEPWIDPSLFGDVLHPVGELAASEVVRQALREVATGRPALVRREEFVDALFRMIRAQLMAHVFDSPSQVGLEQLELLFGGGDYTLDDDADPYAIDTSERLARQRLMEIVDAVTIRRRVGRTGSLREVELRGTGRAMPHVTPQQLLELRSQEAARRAAAMERAAEILETRGEYIAATRGGELVRVMGVEAGEPRLRVRPLTLEEFLRSAMGGEVDLSTLPAEAIESLLRDIRESQTEVLFYTSFEDAEESDFSSALYDLARTLSTRSRVMDLVAGENRVLSLRVSFHAGLRGGIEGFLPALQSLRGMSDVLEADDEPVDYDAVYQRLTMLRSTTEDAQRQQQLLEIADSLSALRSGVESLVGRLAEQGGEAFSLDEVQTQRLFNSFLRAMLGWRSEEIDVDDLTSHLWRIYISRVSYRNILFGGALDDISSSFIDERSELIGRGDLDFIGLGAEFARHIGFRASSPDDWQLVFGYLYHQLSQRGVTIQMPDEVFSMLTGYSYPAHLESDFSRRPAQEAAGVGTNEVAPQDVVRSEPYWSGHEELLVQLGFSRPRMSGEQPATFSDYRELRAEQRRRFSTIFGWGDELETQREAVSRLQEQFREAFESLSGSEQERHYLVALASELARRTSESMYVEGRMERSAYNPAHFPIARALYNLIYLADDDRSRLVVALKRAYLGSVSVRASDIEALQELGSAAFAFAAEFVRTTPPGVRIRELGGEIMPSDPDEVAEFLRRNLLRLMIAHALRRTSAEDVLGELRTVSLEQPLPGGDEETRTLMDVLQDPSAQDVIQHAFETGRARTTHLSPPEITIHHLAASRGDDVQYADIDRTGFLDAVVRLATQLGAPDAQERAGSAEAVEQQAERQFIQLSARQQRIMSGFISSIWERAEQLVKTEKDIDRIKGDIVRLQKGSSDDERRRLKSLQGDLKKLSEELPQVREELMEAISDRLRLSFSAHGLNAEQIEALSERLFHRTMEHVRRLKEAEERAEKEADEASAPEVKAELLKRLRADIQAERQQATKSIVEYLGTVLASESAVREQAASRRESIEAESPSPPAQDIPVERSRDLYVSVVHPLRIGVDIPSAEAEAMVKRYSMQLLRRVSDVLSDLEAERISSEEAQRLLGVAPILSAGRLAAPVQMYVNETPIEMLVLPGGRVSVGGRILALSEGDEYTVHPESLVHIPQQMVSPIRPDEPGIPLEARLVQTPGGNQAPILSISPGGNAVTGVTTGAPHFSLDIETDVGTGQLLQAGLVSYRYSPTGDMEDERYRLWITSSALQSPEALADARRQLELLVSRTMERYSDPLDVARELASALGTEGSVIASYLQRSSLPSELAAMMLPQAPLAPQDERQLVELLRSYPIVQTERAALRSVAEELLRRAGETMVVQNIGFDVPTIARRLEDYGDAALAQRLRETFGVGRAVDVAELAARAGFAEVSLQALARRVGLLPQFGREAHLALEDAILAAQTAYPMQQMQMPAEPIQPGVYLLGLGPGQLYSGELGEPVIGLRDRVFRVEDATYSLEQGRVSMRLSEIGFDEQGQPAVLRTLRFEPAMPGMEQNPLWHATLEMARMFTAVDEETARRVYHEDIQDRVRREIERVLSPDLPPDMTVQPGMEPSPYEREGILGAMSTLLRARVVAEGAPRDDNANALVQWARETLGLSGDEGLPQELLLERAQMAIAYLGNRHYQDPRRREVYKRLWEWWTAEDRREQLGEWLSRVLSYGVEQQMSWGAMTDMWRYITGHLMEQADLPSAPTFVPPHEQRVYNLSMIGARGQPLTISVPAGLPEVSAEAMVLHRVRTQLRHQLLESAPAPELGYAARFEVGMLAQALATGDDDVVRGTLQALLARRQAALLYRSDDAIAREMFQQAEETLQNLLGEPATEFAQTLVRMSPHQFGAELGRNRLVREALDEYILRVALPVDTALASMPDDWMQALEGYDVAAENRLNALLGLAQAVERDAQRVAVEQLAPPPVEDAGELMQRAARHARASVEARRAQSLLEQMMGELRQAGHRVSANDILYGIPIHAAATALHQALTQFAQVGEADIGQVTARMRELLGADVIPLGRYNELRLDAPTAAHEFVQFLMRAPGWIRRYTDAVDEEWLQWVYEQTYRMQGREVLAFYRNRNQSVQVEQPPVTPFPEEYMQFAMETFGRIHGAAVTGAQEETPREQTAAAPVEPATPAHGAQPSPASVPPPSFPAYQTTPPPSTTVYSPSYGQFGLSLADLAIPTMFVGGLAAGGYLLYRMFRRRDDDDEARAADRRETRRTRGTGIVGSSRFLVQANPFLLQPGHHIRFDSDYRKPSPYRLRRMERDMEGLL